MQLTAEADRGSVAQATSRRELRALLGMTLEMATNPALALAEEAFDLRLRPSPATTRCGRDGDDEAMIGIDRHPKAASPGRATERIGRERTHRAIAGGNVIELDGDTWSGIGRGQASLG
jgi:hypothetical protein